MQTLIVLLLPSLLLASPHLATNKDTKEGKDNNRLNVLLMVPCFHFNKSHVNYALSLYMVIRKRHNIRFVVLYAHRNHVDFLEKIAAETNEKNREIELFDMGASENQEMIKIVQEDGTTLEKKFAEGIKYGNYAMLMHFFPYMWIDYMERNNLVPSGDANRHVPVMPPPHYDVGIAEMISFNQHAFAVFHALGIPHCIPTGTMSPSALQFEELGLLDQLVAGNIPPLEKTEFDDHIRRVSTEEEEDNLRKLYEDTSGKEKSNIDAIDRELFKRLPGFKMFSLREKFHRAPLFFYNTRPQLEFDGGKVLLAAGNRQMQNEEEKKKQKKRQRVRMIAGVHVNKGQKALHKHIAKKIEHIKEAVAGGFQGIVLISFGTVISTRDPKKMSAVHFEVLKAVIAAHPRLLFIWKLTTGDERIAELNNSKLNVYSTDWVDQQAILTDRRILAFVSHCGRNSQFEAALFGVPLICVPFFADQFYNAESTAGQQLGSVLNFFCLELAGQQYAVKYSRLNGSMELDAQKVPLAHKSDDHEDIDVVHTKFLEKYGQRTVTVKSRNGGGAYKEESVLTLIKEPSEICFTPANIAAKLKEAIAAKKQLHEAIADKDYSKSALAKVMQQLQQSPAAGLVLEALEEILKENKKKAMKDAGTSSMKKRQQQKSVKVHTYNGSGHPNLG